jgi:hypothetical protein
MLLAPTFVLAINNPLMWNSQSNGSPAAAVGVSTYVGIGHHHALRLNVASYEVDNAAEALGALAAGGDFGDGTCGTDTSGHADDIGAGWMYFLRERFHGPSFELGVVRRDQALTHCKDDPGGLGFETRSSTSVTYAGRALASWSWLSHEHLFASVSGGISVGREAGEYTDTHARYHDVVAAPELFVRIGWGFR